MCHTIDAGYGYDPSYGYFHFLCYGYGYHLRYGYYIMYFVYGNGYGYHLRYGYYIMYFVMVMVMIGDKTLDGPAALGISWIMVLVIVMV